MTPTQPRPLKSAAGVAACALGCLALTLLMFGPRLWLMRSYLPGTFQWDRAHSFLLQCAAPLRRDVEPAMLWRLLPPLVCHALGLTGYAALLLPFVGVLVLVGYVVVLHRRRLNDLRFVFGGTLLFTTTSCVLVPLHWLGVNDAWVWLALLAVSFSPARWPVAVACLLAPWVDERFIIGLPLALLVRAADRGEAFAWRSVVLPGLCLLPYAGLRLAFAHDPAGTAATRAFLRQSVLHQAVLIAPWAPLGWWMGLRAAWVPAAYAISHRRWALGTAVALTALVSLALAADLSRSIAVVEPVALLGVFLAAQRWPDRAPAGALALGGAGLLIPAAHVVGAKLDLISPLPLELFRLLRGG
jgi:hypothetical protein